MSPLHSRMQEQDGAIAIMAAVLATAMVLAGALAVDVGRVAYVSRDQQGATDRAALDSAQTLRAVDNRASGAAVEEAYEEASESLDRNPMTGTQRDRTLYRVDLGVAEDPDATSFELVCGAYFDEDGAITDRGHLVDVGILAASGDPDADPDSAAAQDAPEDCDADGIEGTEVDALRLWTFGAVDYVLALGGSGTTMHKLASASAAPWTEEADGTYSVGSTLASMNDDLLDQWLIEALEIEEADAVEFDVDLVGYRGIASGRVQLGDLVAADSLTVGSVDELLSAQVSVTELLQATVDVLEADGDAAALELAGEIDGLLSFVVGATYGGFAEEIPLGHDDVHVGGLAVATGSGSGADVRIDAVDLVLLALQLANGDNAVDLRVPVHGRTVDVAMTIIESPVTMTGPTGTQIETGQVRLDLDLDLEPLVSANSELEEAVDEILDSLLDLLGTLLGGVLGSDPEVTLHEVGVSVWAAEGTGTLTGIGCETPGQLTIDSLVSAAQVTVAGDLYDVDGDLVSVGGDDGVAITFGESSEPATSFLDGPFPTGPVRAPEGGVDFNTSLSAQDLEAEGDLVDELDELLDPTTDLLEAALVGTEGLVAEILDQLGLGLTTVDVLAYDYNCTQVGLQPSLSDS